MANLLDYLTWRGDLPFKLAPFNDVDALILSRLSYAPFEGIVSEAFNGECVSIKFAAERLIDLTGGETPGRSFRIEEDADLMRALINSERFAPLLLTGYVNRLDTAQEKQFSAVTVLLQKDEFFVAFRGTDGTLVGWKEDFNMGFEEVVPAQSDAAAYLAEAAKNLKGSIRVGGHSKGGNLAVYASAFCDKRIQKRILRVNNNDGPGFSAKSIATEGFAQILPRVRTYVPQSSVVGMLLEHEEDYSVIHSTNSGLMQHDMYSWEVVRDGFVNVGSTTNSSQFIDMALKDWMSNMPADLREKLIDGVYSVISSADAHTLRELWSGKNTITILKGLRSLDDETRELMGQAFDIFKQSLKKSLPVMMDMLPFPTRKKERLPSAE